MLSALEEADEVGGIALRHMLFYGMVWYGMLWCGVVWCDVV